MKNLTTITTIVLQPRNFDYRYILDFYKNYQIDLKIFFDK